MICYVTAFLDLHRHTWAQHSRTFDDYLASFIPLIPLVENDPDATCLVFLDDTHTIPQLADTTSFRVIPINRDVLSSYPIWSTLPTEQRILNDASMRRLVAHRKSCPECWNAEYTLINHSKVDFMAHATRVSDAAYFAWIDFGYFALPSRIPSQLLDVSALDTDRINYTLINPVQPVFSNVVYMLTRAPECFGGFFFFGPRRAILEYQHLYHDVLHTCQEKYGIADDDQHLAMMCYFRRPNLFTLHHLGGWHRALTYFAKH